MYCALGAFYFIQARWLYGGPKPLVVPTDFAVSDDGIVYARRGTSEAVAVPWKRASSVRKLNEGFIMMVRSRREERMLFIPKPSDESLVRAIWAMCYAHMVDTRGLRQSSPDRLGNIENTMMYA
jgi:hypothetical protein